MLDTAADSATRVHGPTDGALCRVQLQHVSAGFPQAHLRDSFPPVALVSVLTVPTSVAPPKTSKMAPSTLWLGVLNPICCSVPRPVRNSSTTLQRRQSWWSSGTDKEHTDRM